MLVTYGMPATVNSAFGVPGDRRSRQQPTVQEQFLCQQQDVELLISTIQILHKEVATVNWEKKKSGLILYLRNWFYMIFLFKAGQIFIIQPQCVFGTLLLSGQSSIIYLLFTYLFIFFQPISLLEDFCLQHLSCELQHFDVLIPPSSVLVRATETDCLSDCNPAIGSPESVQNQIFGWGLSTAVPQVYYSRYESWSSLVSLPQYSLWSLAFSYYSQDSWAPSVWSFCSCVVLFY